MGKKKPMVLNIHRRVPIGAPMVDIGILQEGFDVREIQEPK
jgi:hypothetical protein